MLWLLSSLRHQQPWYWLCGLTHWERVTHTCVSKLIIIGSDNGLSPGRRKAIIWTNAGIVLIGSLGTNFSEILIKTYKCSLKNTFENVVWKMAAILSRPQCVNESEWRDDPTTCNCCGLVENAILLFSARDVLIIQTAIYMFSKVSLRTIANILLANSFFPTYLK